MWDAGTQRVSFLSKSEIVFVFLDTADIFNHTENRYYSYAAIIIHTVCLSYLKAFAVFSHEKNI